MINFKKESGFTLVELAIVMVVIALLVTIVAAGKNIIAAGKVRAVLKEVEEIQSAFVRFQEKYSDLPGDMQDAWTFWGTDCADVQANCNGNGDEQITWDEAASGTTYHEGAQAWNQLQLSGMLGGEPLVGQNGSPRFGTNMPVSKISNAGWTVDYNDIITGVNALRLGGEAAAGSSNITTVIVPKDAFTIDNKLDDGFPTTGRVIGEETTAGECIDGTVYNIDNTKKECSMAFQLDTSL